MKRAVFLLAMTVAAVRPAVALDHRTLDQLKVLDPVERMEQRCDIEAMERIKREQAEFRPDKVVAYSFADPVVTGNAMKAPGAVVRSRGAWYRLKYKCTTGPQHLQVLGFQYKLGAIVPRRDWEKHYLYD
ncbi:MAG: DUF930 domain-containing protein [Allorhizobium sp.]